MVVIRAWRTRLPEAAEPAKIAVPAATPAEPLTKIRRDILRLIPDLLALRPISLTVLTSGFPANVRAGRLAVKRLRCAYLMRASCAGLPKIAILRRMDHRYLLRCSLGDLKIPKPKM